MIFGSSLLAIDIGSAAIKVVDMRGGGQTKLLQELTSVVHGGGCA